MIRLSRNYGFIQRLPNRFTLKVLSQGNLTDNGCWYYVNIDGHELNLLSEATLKEGDIVEVEKESNLILRILSQIHRNILLPDPNKNIDLSA